MNFNNLTKFLNMLIDIGIPGCSIIINYKHQQVYKNNFGYADIENKRPYTANSLINLWSASKPITCVAGMKLFEEGRFLLTDPVYKYLPEFKNMSIKKLLDGKEEFIPATIPILVKDLFSMTAGFTYDINTENMRAYKTETNGKCPTKLLCKYISKEPLSFEPGSHWAYSLCHDVLGALIEEISEKKFGDYVREKIFEPLNMKDSTFERTEKTISKMAMQYCYNYKKETAEKVSKDNMYYFGSEYQSGGAGIISTAEDYSKFVEMLINNGNTKDGENIISKAVIDLMRTNQMNSNMLKDFNWPHLTGYGYGLGVRTLISNQTSLSSLGEFGWSGYAGCYVLADPEKELSIFYSQHMYNNLEDFIHPRIRNIVYSCLEKN